LADDPSLEVRDEPFVPPRFEPRRLFERVLANIGAVCIWTVRVREQTCTAARTCPRSAR
jgi:hypothetical protein